MLFEIVRNSQLGHIIQMRQNDSAGSFYCLSRAPQCNRHTRTHWGKSRGGSRAPVGHTLHSATRRTYPNVGGIHDSKLASGGQIAHILAQLPVQMAFLQL